MEDMALNLALVLDMGAMAFFNDDAHIKLL